MKSQLLKHPPPLSSEYSTWHQLSIYLDNFIYPMFNWENSVIKPFFLPFPSFSLERYDCPWLSFYSFFHCSQLDSFALGRHLYFWWISFLLSPLKKSLIQGNNSFLVSFFLLFLPYSFSCFVVSFINFFVRLINIYFVFGLNIHLCHKIFLLVLLIQKKTQDLLKKNNHSWHISSFYWCQLFYSTLLCAGTVPDMNYSR